MRIGSLFSGAGGLDLAVEAVFGATTAWHSELDPAATKVLAHRWPGVPNLGDITTIDWTAIEPVDILCGGFPCTDVSSAGRRAGLHNTRSGLWIYYADAIDALRPQIVVIENVRGLLSAHAGRPMEPDPVPVGDGGTNPVLRAAGAVLGDLVDLGYDAQWATVAASSVGAPHRRERVFILATDTQRIGQQRPAHNPSQGQSDTAGRDLWLQPDRCGKASPCGPHGQRRPTTDTDSTSRETLSGRPGARDTRRLQPVECGSQDRQRPTSDAAGDAGWLIDGDSGTTFSPPPARQTVRRTAQTSVARAGI